MEFAGSVTPADMGHVISQLLDLVARAEREGCRIGLLALLDSLNPARVTAGMRKEHVELLRKHLPRLAAVTCAEARLVTSPILRGVLTAMSWLLPHPWPVEVFSQERDAFEWLKQRCCAECA
jgi:hypothetical protein